MIKTDELNIRVQDGVLYYRHNGLSKQYTIQQVIKYANLGEIPAKVLEHPEVKEMIRKHFTKHE